MRPPSGITKEARVLGVRLRLGLVGLPEVEAWAQARIAEPGGDAGKLAELCSARALGPEKAVAELAQLGGKAGEADVIAALASVDQEDLDDEEIEALADNVQPVLRELVFEKTEQELLWGMMEFASEFWAARQASDRDRLVELIVEMRALLRDIRMKVEGAASTVRRPMLPNLKVSAIVVSFNTGSVLFEAIAALEADLDIAEVVLVDNGNPPDVVAKLAEMARASAKLRCIDAGGNHGFAAGVNLGAKSATGDRLLILNPDAILQPNAVVALEAARAGASEPAVVGGRIYGDDGKEQRGGRRKRLTFGTAAGTFLGLGWLPGLSNINLNLEPAPSGPIPVGAVSGALMYLSRAGFDRLHGFDEGYFLHVEDLDLCRRAETEGGSVIYTPFAAALHHGATSDMPAAAVEKHKAAGLGRYFRKFARSPGEKIAAAVLAPVFGAALAARAAVRGK